MLATISCLVVVATSPFYHFLPISLLVLISRVFRLLSPRDSPDTITTVAGAGDTSAGDATELKWELNEDLGRCYVSFPDDQ